MLLETRLQDALICQIFRYAIDKWLPKHFIILENLLADRAAKWMMPLQLESATSMKPSRVLFRDAFEKILINSPF